MTTRLRTATASVLVVLAAVLTPVAAVGMSARALLTSTDAYVAVVGPMADDAAVQALVTDRVTTAVVAALPTGRWADQAGDSLPTLAGWLRPVLAQAVTDLVRSQVSAVVGSAAFGSTWRQANRVAHSRLVAVLAGDSQLVSIGPDGTLSLDLAPVARQVRDRLVARGLTAAGSASIGALTVPLLTHQGLVDAQRVYRLVRAAVWLPWLALAALVGAVLVAPRRARTALVAGLAGLGAVLLVAAAIRLAGPGLAGRALAVPDGVTSALVAAVGRALRAALLAAGATCAAVAAAGAGAGLLAARRRPS